MNSDPSVFRGALVIVLAGASLGMVYNGMALRSHPPHGIPWIAVKEELPSLVDSIASAPISEPPAPEVSPAAPQASSAPSHPAGPATSTHPTTSPGSSPPPATGSTGAPQTSGGTSPSPSPISSAPDARVPVPLPFIPESDKPIQVQLATAKRFFAARAALFLDARDPAEYEAGHIPGAIRLTGPEANTDPEKMKTLPAQGRPIICYCEGGACEASLDLAKTLIENGYKKVLVYMGGFPEWSADGQPVEKGAGK
jgi:rhodanese-related sulfurtransferase